MCLVLGACVWIYFGDGDNYKKFELYVVIILLGAGGTTILVTSLSITADLIGNNVVCPFIVSFNIKQYHMKLFICLIEVLHF